jgi:hypothetical protein
MRKLVVALVALTAAAALVVMGLPALAAGGPRSFKAHSQTVRAGQRIKVSGKGCGSQAFVRFYLNDFEIDSDRADNAGQFVDNVEVPASTDLGKAQLKAGCSGFRVGLVTITVLGSRFDVEPRRVEAGELITVSGTLCKPRSYVTIKLNGQIIGSTRANARGQFRKRVAVPGDAEGSDEVSSRCHGKFVGVKIIIIVVIYPTQQSLVSADRTAVPAGQTVTLRGADCPTGNPTASLDGQQLNLDVDRSATGKGFKATATIPSSVSPGRHSLRAGCDAGSAGTTELQVLEGAQPAAARMEFGPQPPSDLALWLGLFSGIAVLAASVAITTRRRRRP